MRLVKIAALLVLLLGLAACGYVEGNYPEPKTAPPVLPDTWTTPQGEDLVMIWDRAPEWRGFFNMWYEMKMIVPMLEEGSAAGNRRAATVLDEVKAIDEEGLTIFSMSLFVSKDAELRLTKGRLTIQFGDGTSTQDEGLYFVENHKKGPRLHSTRSSSQTITAKYTETGKPMTVIIAVPAESHGKKVREIQMR